LKPIKNKKEEVQARFWVLACSKGVHQQAYNNSRLEGIKKNSIKHVPHSASIRYHFYVDQKQQMLYHKKLCIWGNNYFQNMLYLKFQILHSLQIV